MERGEEITHKKDRSRPSMSFWRFVDKRIDWIMLVVITLLILLILTIF